jgi:polar amino acid transport system permease protein
MNPYLVPDLRQLWVHLPDFGSGLAVTVALSAAATPLAMTLGVALALGRMSSLAPVRLISTAYVEVLRNIPGLVLIYFLFFMLPLTGVLLSPFASAVAALSAQHAAFFAEIYRGGIQSISPGQIDAGRAIGLRHFQIMRLIVFPQVLRDVIPPMGNEIILLMLNTAVASTIGVAELTQRANVIGESTAATFPVYVFAGALYLITSAGLAGVLRWAERRYRVRR